MPSISILTDSAAQFIHTSFPGNDLVEIIPLNSSQDAEDSYVLSSPPDQIVHGILKNASENSATVFAILSSGGVSALPNQILRLMREASAAPRIIMIDTQSIGVGTGFIVEKAAEMAVSEKNSNDIERTIRQICPSIYVTSILPDLKPLVPLGLVDKSQAQAAEILGIQSIFSLEEGLPTPFTKVRNRHSAIEYLVEYLDEFEIFYLVGFIKEPGSENNEQNLISDHLEEFFPDVKLLTFISNSNWQTVFGKKSFGLVVISKEEN